MDRDVDMDIDTDRNTDADIDLGRYSVRYHDKRYRTKPYIGL